MQKVSVINIWKNLNVHAYDMYCEEMLYNVCFSQKLCNMYVCV